MADSVGIFYASPVVFVVNWYRLVQLIPESILMKLDPRSQQFNKFRLV
jgi:hypothetical protein